MKKVLVSLLALSMVASLAACGGNKPAETKAPETKGEQVETKGEEQTPAGDLDEEAEMTFAWWGNQQRTENTQNAIDMYMEQHSNVTMEGQPYQWNDYWTVLSTSAAGDSLPDIIQQDYVYIDQFVKDNNLVDLMPYVESGALDISKISDSVTVTGKVGDGLYAICAGVNAPCLVYNKTLMDENGIEVPFGMTIDQFNEISKEINEKAGVKTNYWYGESENMLTYFVRSQGYDAFFDQDKFAFESADVLTPWYDWCKAAVDEGWALDAAVSAENSTSVEMNPVVNYSSPATQSWCCVSFSNMIVGYQKAAPEGVQLAMTQYPSDDQAASNYLKPSQFFSVTTDTKHEAIAVDFVNFLTNDEDVNVQFLRGERGIPVNSDVAAKVAEAADDGGITVMIANYINDVVTPTCSPIFPPLPAASSQVVKEVIASAAESVLYGKTSPAEAAEFVFTKGNEILGAK